MYSGHAQTYLLQIDELKLNTVMLGPPQALLHLLDHICPRGDHTAGLRYIRLCSHRLRTVLHYWPGEFPIKPVIIRVLVTCSLFPCCLSLSLSLVLVLVLVFSLSPPLPPSLFPLSLSLVSSSHCNLVIHSVSDYKACIAASLWLSLCLLNRTWLSAVESS